MSNAPQSEADRLIAARESFSGRLLTDRQFDEAIAITRIMERGIHQTGTFREKLGDYAYAFARTEGFSAIKAEETIRDLFKLRTGQSMNQMREALVIREGDFFTEGDRMDEHRQPRLTTDQQTQALVAARGVGEMMRTGDKISFHRAYTHQGRELAESLGTTERAACRLMSHAFETVEGKSLHDWGKTIEDQHYRVQVDAEKRARQSGQVRQRTRA